MRVLFTNNTLAARAGTELYVRDVALAVQRRGHQAIAYSATLGEVAAELRASGVAVTDDLATLDPPPDVIHGHHHLETMTALLSFPGVPGVAYCHSSMEWQEWVADFPRLRRYVAVDEPCRTRIVEACGIAAERVVRLLNFVDLARFQPRAPLPARPQRVLLLDGRVRPNDPTAARCAALASAAASRSTSRARRGARPVRRRSRYSERMTWSSRVPAALSRRWPSGRPSSFSASVESDRS